MTMYMSPLPALQSLVEDRQWVSSDTMYLPIYEENLNGKRHQDADCLSRSPLPQSNEDNIPELSSITDIRKEQRSDVQTKIIQEIDSKSESGYEITDGILYRKNYDPMGKPWLLVVPKQMRVAILREAHDAPMAGHLGFAKTYDRIIRQYFWPGLHRSVRQYVAHCRECQRRKDANTKLAVKGQIPAISEEFIVSATNSTDEINRLISKYKNLCTPNLVPAKLLHKVEHQITTTGPPVFSKARQLDTKRLRIPKQEFQYMLENDIIRPSKSQWASPLHMTLKKDGTIDLLKAYYQRITEEDKEETAVITPFGLFEFNVMSFGLRNAPATFQIFINEVLFGLDFVFPYIDDILIVSTNKEEHEFGVQEVEFLGHLITKEGSRPLPSKTKTVRKYKLPETIQDLRTFLGMINFYRRYLKDAAETQAVLHEFLKDTSNRAVGAILQQYEENGWKRIAFYSKKLNDTQKSFSTYDRELLAIYLSVENFKHTLEGRDFKIYTDHKPLKYAFLQRNEKASPRQLRHLQYIYQFTKNIEHVDGKRNIVADTLSRIEEVSMIDYNEIELKQINDPEVISLKQQNNLKKKFHQYPLPPGKILWCDTSTSNIRPFVLKEIRKKMFQLIHGTVHPGIKASVKQMTARFIWTNIKKDVQEWARTCMGCQINKISRHTKSEIGPFPKTADRFSVVHIDLIPLKDIKAETLAKAFYENWIARFGMPTTVITDCAKQFKPIPNLH
ncbi:hypothetical protein LAZ67_4002211 [Cordylochernes scorpioides]|uniref:RNA-directed DNA polymerase n=1 Tax=Cordylochernes scorpioides TaxID=51811 RepID=A0ABY6KCT8_9ARAC|nr:hypothetical protein LAZ67_4002211 [Cordylochernes scorpioides]